MIHGQVGEKGLNFGAAHLTWVPLVVEQDETFDPVYVGLLCVNGIMLEPQNIPNLVEQLPGALFHSLTYLAKLDSELFGILSPQECHPDFGTAGLRGNLCDVTRVKEETQV